MEKRDSGLIAKPAPPGRRRGPASRNASSTSNRAVSGPSSSASGLFHDDDDDADTLSEDKQSDEVGLHFASPMTISKEIPLEEVEKALSGLSREELVLALKRAKEQMDIVSEKRQTDGDDRQAYHLLSRQFCPA
jgi:hypothetical protein